MLISTKPRIFDVDLYGLAAALGIIALTWLLVVKPLDKRLQKHQMEQQGIVKNKESAQRQLAQLRNLLRQKQVLASQLSHTRNVLLDNTGMPELVRSLGTLAEDYKLSLEEITPGDTQVNQHFRKTEMELSLNGPFPCLGDFLAEISRKLAFIRIKNLAIIRQKGSTSSTNIAGAGCNINMVLDVFAPK